MAEWFVIISVVIFIPVSCRDRAKTSRYLLGVFSPSHICGALSRRCLRPQQLKRCALSCLETVARQGLFESLQSVILNRS